MISQGLGRRWGVKGRGDMQLTKKVIINFLKEEDYERVIDFMTFYTGLGRDDWMSLEVFIDGRKFLNELDKIIKY